MTIIIKIIRALFYILLSFIYGMAMLYGKYDLYSILAFTAVFSALAMYVSFNHRHLKIDYYSYYSKLKNTNPYIKTLFFVFVLFYCVFAERISVSIFVLLTMTFITVGIGKINIKNYIYAMLLPLCFIMLSTITIAINFTNSPIGENSIAIGNFYISFCNRYRTIELLFRSLGAVSCLYALSMSTPIGDIVEVLYGIHCPKLIVELMFLIYRFIFLLQSILESLTTAAISRGGYSSYKNSFKAYGQIGANLFIYALKKTNIAFDAMVSRGYNGNISFYTDFEAIKIINILFIVVYCLLLLGVTICLK